MKFSTQVAFWSALLALASLLSFAFVASIAHDRSELLELDNELKLQVDHFLGEFGQRHNDIQWITQKEFDEIMSVSRDPHIFTEIIGPSGRVLAQSISLHGEILGRVEPGFGWSVFSGKKVRTLSVTQGQAVIRMAADLVEIEEEQAALNRAFVYTLPVMILCVSIGAWFISQRALRPIRNMALSAARISAHALDARLPVPSTKDEIHQLAEAFNESLSRLSASFVQATRFSADASHELKTPLAVIRAVLGKLMASPALAPNDRAEVAEAMDQVVRITGITESLLLLSRADSGRLSLSNEPIRIGEVIAGILEDYSLLAADKDLTITSNIPSDIRVAGVSWAIHQIVLNLLDNALKYSTPNGQVTLECRVNPKQIGLRIANTSADLSPQDALHLFDRFWRSAHTSDIPGTGLGLSIARELARAMDGNLALIPSASGWTRFELTLKRESDVRPVLSPDLPTLAVTTSKEPAPRPGASV